MPGLSPRQRGDKNQALKNNGYLALLSPRFFGFGVEMMKVIDREIHADIFKTSGGDCLLDAEKAIFAELPMLMAVFDMCCKFEVEDEVFAIDEDDADGDDDIELWRVQEEHVADIIASKVAKEAMVTVILKKATHSYYNSYLKIFQQNTIKRKGTDHTPAPFRVNLKAYTSGAPTSDKC